MMFAHTMCYKGIAYGIGSNKSCTDGLRTTMHLAVNLCRKVWKMIAKILTEKTSASERLSVWRAAYNQALTAAAQAQADGAYWDRTWLRKFADEALEDFEAKRAQLRAEELNDMESTDVY